MSYLALRISRKGRFSRPTSSTKYARYMQGMWSVYAPLSGVEIWRGSIADIPIKYPAIFSERPSLLTLNHKIGEAGMKYAVGNDKRANLDGLLRCPECGAALVTRLLKLDGEDAGEAETLLLLDCPKGHVYATVTHKDVSTKLAAEVMRCLEL